MGKPEDPASPTPRAKVPLPSAPKRAPTAPTAATPPATTPTAATPPAAAAPAAPATGVPAPAKGKEKEKVPEKGKDKNNATMVMAVPPPPAPPTQQAQRPTPTSQATAAPQPTPAPAAPAPAPAPAAAAAPADPPAEGAPRRKHSDTLTNALDDFVMELQAEAGSGAIIVPPAHAAAAAATAKDKPGVVHGVSTPEDLAAVRGLFHDVAVSHVSHVRDVMLELRYGDADPRWIEMTKPALRSLRAMAGQMEIMDLVEALDAFVAAVDSAVASRATITEEDKAELQRRYSKLIELIPQAFELDAERDRREPIIVEALLYQVAGVEQPTIEKLFAVGLGRLEALMSAKADEVAAVTGLRIELATAIVEQFRSYRATATAALSAPDPAVELSQLSELLIMLSIQNDDFIRASSEWTDEAQQRKRTLRKQRDQTFLQIKVALARLGQRDQLQRLEKLSFQDRINMIDQYLSSQQQVRPST